MNDIKSGERHRRQLLRLALGAAALSTLWQSAQAQSRAGMRRLGIFSLLGDSIRVVGSQTREALFKDIAMDKLTFDAVGAAMLASRRPNCATFARRLSLTCRTR